MIYLEDITETILNEEGQLLMGMDFIQNVLGLNYKRIETIFIKCANEYSRRRPVIITGDFNGSPTIKMPDNTLSIKAVRYGVLPDYPRFFQDPFGELSYEFDPANKILKVFPPNTQVKVTYNAYIKPTNNQLVIENMFIVPEQTEIDDVMKSSFIKGTLKIIGTGGELEEVSRTEIKTKDEYDNEYVETTVKLGGTLGSGTINLNTREFHIDLVNPLDIAEELVFTYYPKYKVIKELDNNGDFVFYKLFAYNLLKALAVLRTQATQENLHNIDLTNDGLLERIAILGAEVRKLMRSTISFSGLADI